MFSTAFLDLPALQGASGTVTLPGSKSISNRVLLLSALCQGTTVVHDLLDSDDTRVMLAALRQLGCRIDYLDNEGFPPLRIGPPTLNLSAPIKIRPKAPCGITALPAKPTS